MKVYVIMGNDYPAAVYDNEQSAKDRCDCEAAKNDVRVRDGCGKIYWRVYEFEVEK